MVIAQDYYYDHDYDHYFITFADTIAVTITITIVVSRRLATGKRTPRSSHHRHSPDTGGRWRCGPGIWGGWSHHTHAHANVLANYESVLLDWSTAIRRFRSSLGLI